MNEGSGAVVAWILVPLFAVVGLYLIWYSLRRKTMLEAFAKNHRLRIRPEYEEELQNTLDSCFSLRNKNLVRSFGQLSSICEGGSVWLFRGVELLDLDPHAQSYSTHFPRIAALFDVPASRDEFFVLGKSMNAIQRLPGANAPSPEVVSLSKRIAVSCNLRHSLSVTLARGQGLIYLEPSVTGGETMSDVNALYCVAKKMRRELAVIHTNRR